MLGGILVANIVVVVVKFTVGLDTNSLAVFGDALQSSVDAANNLIGIFVVRVAAKAPDEDHPYGHDKFETLGALLIALLLALSIFELVRGLCPPMSGPHHERLGTALGFLVFNPRGELGVSGLRAGRCAGSGATFFSRCASNTRTDVLITLGVLGGLAWRAQPCLGDPALALIVAVLVGAQAPRSCAGPSRAWGQRRLRPDDHPAGCRRRRRSGLAYAIRSPPRGDRASPSSRSR